MNYILVAHGQYAEACLRSCEMITGKKDHFFSVTFTDEMSREMLLEKCNDILKHRNNERFIFLTDILGGTPYHVTKIMYAKKDNVVGVLSGLSLQLLLPLSLGEHISKVINDQQQLISFEAKYEKWEEQNTIHETVIRETAQENGIIHIRIDERLIHGQVATAWIGSLAATRVMVIDNHVVKSDMEKSALRAACPKNIRLSILTVENAAKRLNAGDYADERVLLIMKNSEMVKALHDKHVKIKQVNIGNMSKKENRDMLKKSVYMSKEEFQILTSLEDHGVIVTVQMVPSEDKKNISDYKEFMNREG